MTNYRKFENIEKMRVECDPEVWLWFSKDITDGGHKSFFSIKKQNFNDFSIMFDNNQHIYEILPNEPIFPYFDCEMEGVDNFEEKLKQGLELLRKVFQEEFDIQIQAENFVILDSCRANKLSYHVVIRDVCYFNNVSNAKQFMTWLFDKCIHDEALASLVWFYGEEKRFIFDKVPYGSNQNVRMLGQSKKGKPYVLTSNDSLERTMIRCLDVRGLVELQTEKFNAPVKEKTKKIKSTKSVEVKETTEMNEIQLVYKEELTDYLKYKLLNKVALEGTWEDWRNVGFAMFHTFQEKGLELFIEFSKINTTKFDSDTTMAFYRSLKVIDSKRPKITFRSIQSLAKKSDKILAKRIYDNYCDKIQQKQYASNDYECAEIIREMLGENIMFCQAMYLKKGNVWINDQDHIQAFIINMIMSAPIFKENGDKTVQAWANYSSATNVFKTVRGLLELENQKTDKFHTTTLYRLCFLDGVLDFKQKRFYLWEDVDFEYYSVVQIPMEYNDYLLKHDEKVVLNIKQKILEPLFGDKMELALKYLARAFAGCIQDKNFATYLANRNCGKGVLFELLSAFGDYMKPFVVANIMCGRNTQREDTSRMLYWLMDFEFVRLGLGQETPKPTEGLKIRSDLIKKICSGGDRQTARRNYDRKDTTFLIDLSLFLAGNDALIMEGDVAEHHLSFGSSITFMTQDKIDSAKEEKINELVLSTFRVADPTIKDKAKTVEYHKAMIYIIFEAFKDEVISVIQQDDDREKTLGELILEEYEITNNADDKVLGSELKSKFGKKTEDTLKEFGIKLTKDKSRDEFRDKMIFKGMKKRSNDQ